MAPNNFRNEIIWQRTLAKALTSRQLPNNHDILLCYQKSDDATYNGDAMFQPYDLANLDEKTASKYTHHDPDGRLYQLDNLINPNPDRPNLTYEFLGITRVWRWTKERMQAAYDAGLVIQPNPGSVPRYKRYLDEQRGRPLGDVWTDIPPINSQAQERLGYPTQKPLALLERIINASSNPGDVVLDPFCGCGTAVHAAQKLGRNWIGIDITPLAITLIEKRLKEAFPALQFAVEGIPTDLDGAKDLAARDKYHFQWWACALVGAQPYQGKKKGADSGIDGVIYFSDDKGPAKKIIVSVKGGETVTVSQIRDLAHVIDREQAVIGLFVTLASPTRPMKVEAVSAGHYQSANFGAFDKVQILTIEGLLNGTEQAHYPDLSRGSTGSRKARVEEADGQQGELGL